MSLSANIANISRCSLHDGPGVRTVVYFTGCGLSCLWCHNPETISFRGEVMFAPVKCVHCGRCVAVCPEHHIIQGNDMVFLREGCEKCGKCVEACPSGALSLSKASWTVEKLLKEILKEKHYFLQNGGVTLSGGECLLQADFCQELLAQCKDHGIHTAVETALFVPYQNIEKIIPVCDFFFADFKIPDSEKHKRYTGKDNALILENLQKLSEAAKGKVTVRIPLIPSVNDGQEDIIAFGEKLGSIAEKLNGIEVLRYNNLAEAKYQNAGKTYTAFGQPQSDDQLKAYCAALEEALHHKTCVYCVL